MYISGEASQTHTHTLEQDMRSLTSHTASYAESSRAASSFLYSTYTARYAHPQF